MTHLAENDAPRLVHLSGKCPHCDVRKHQIDTSEEHAIQVLNDAFDRHIRDEHPGVIPPAVQDSRPAGHSTPTVDRAHPASPAGSTDRPGTGIDPAGRATTREGVAR